MAAGFGMTHEEIAIGIGISRPTLEKHFSLELSTGAYQRRMEVIEAMHAAALKGSAAAGRAFMAMDPRIAPPPPDPVEKDVPVGKKEQANQDAKTAHSGTEWHGILAAPGVQ